MRTTPPLIVIPSDSPSIFDSLTTLQKRAIVRPNNPPPGIAGYLFDIPGDEELRLRSLITKHYTEDNTPVQDQIGLEPEEIKLRGVVAELSTGLPASVQIARVQRALPINIGFLPVPSPAQVNGLVASLAAEAGTRLAAIAGALAVAALSSLYAAFNEAQTAAVANAAVDAAKTAFDNTNDPPESVYSYEQGISPQQPGQTDQSNAAAYFYQLWLGRMRFSVETPFGVMNNMAILDAHILQEASSRQRSNFTITFQKIRVSGDPQIAAGQLAGRRALQGATPTQNGVAGQQPVSAAQAVQLFKSFA